MAHAAQATIWLANLDSLPGELVPEWAATLSEGERQRYRAFVRAERQRQFVAGRMMMRRAAGDIAGIPVAAIEVEEQLGRPPLLALPGRRPAPYFSISHSGPWVACAVSIASPLGLDIEVRDPQRDIVALSEQAFGPEQARRLKALSLEARLAQFYEMWCRDEAQYKLGQEARCCHKLPHQQIEIALCAARVLSGAPELRIVESLADFVQA